MSTQLPPLDLATLLQPISGAHPAGTFDEDEATFQLIDQEMIKLGGLHESGMDWKQIDEGAQRYLTTQCKHLRVAGHLITSRLRSKSWRDWTDALALLSGLIEHYWQTAFPVPGPKGLVAKRRHIAALIERLIQALPHLVQTSFTPAQADSAQAVAASLQSTISSAELDSALVTQLSASLGKWIELNRTPAPEELKPKPGQHGGNVINEQYFTTQHTLQLGNERDNRRALLAVAEFINEQDAYDPTGYQVRRFALWGHLRSAPATRREQRTELMGVPADIVQGYQDALDSNRIDPPLLQRVEKSVVSSPYWIHGSHLAAQIAERLEMPEVTAAIRLTVERFVTRMPTLRHLQFSDGRPFIDERTYAWLSGADGQGGSQAPGNHAQGLVELREELIAELDTSGVEAALRRLQEYQSASQVPRQHHYATVIAADLLASRGLSWLSDGLYQNVSRFMREHSIEHWETDLYQYLLQRVPQSPVIGQ